MFVINYIGCKENIYTIASYLMCPLLFGHSLFQWHVSKGSESALNANLQFTRVHACMCACVYGCLLCVKLLCKQEGAV